jgi:hypothetical protein
MEDPPETDRLLQLQLRTGIVKESDMDGHPREYADTYRQLSEFLSRRTYRDWFKDDQGRVWEWGFDIDRNLHRWQEVNLDIVGPMAAEFEVANLSTVRDLYAYGFNGQLYKLLGDCYKLVGLAEDPGKE